MTLQGDRARLAPCGADVRLARDAGVRGLACLRKRRRLGADPRQRGTRAGGDQAAPDLRLGVAVTALAHPSLRQCSVVIALALRRPGVLADGLSCRTLSGASDR